MSNEIKNNTTELTDEEVEKAAGGATVTGKPAKRCLNMKCYKDYPYELTACPYCGFTLSMDITVYPKSPGAHNGSH